jgi:cytochrome c
MNNTAIKHLDIERSILDLTNINREIRSNIVNVPNNYLALELSLLKANMLFASTLESPNPEDSYNTNIEDDDNHYMDDTNQPDKPSSSDNYIWKDDKIIQEDDGGRPYPKEDSKVHMPRRV